ncbi:MAG: NAD(P)-dependent oxidoreductase [Patescibacteria group bacterium]
MREEAEAKIGIVGTGFIARGLSYSLRNDESLEISRVLTRRKPEQVCDLAVNNCQITNSIQELVDTSDIVVECSGDPIYATKVLLAVMDAGIPVVTMDSELQVTTGSWLARKGLITEAEGDQPGSIAALHHEVLAMGFEPIVLGNIKGFLNHTPTEDEMKYWAGRSGISLEQVTSFTDGTKIQIEQTLVANGLGAEIAQRGLIGVECVDYQDGAKKLAENADSLGLKISDYVLSPKSPAGVLLNNGENPHASVATVAKRRLFPGEVLKRGIGSFTVRGEAVKIADYPEHLPIGLVFDVVLKRYVEPGQIITFDDIEIPESQALVAWQETIKQK